MSEAYIGEIRIFAGNFAPRDWLKCDGTLLEISLDPTLFSVLGTMYGGDGRKTFALPDLRGMAAGHAGTGTGLTYRPQGTRIGSATEQLTEEQMPAHTHTARGSRNVASTVAPANAFPATGATPRIFNYHNSDPSVTPFSHLQSAGGGSEHNNMQPYLPLMFIICRDGVYPSHR